MNRRPPAPAAARPSPVVPEGPREVAAAALQRVLDDAAWAQPTLSAGLDASAMSDRDKALATELFYGALRFAGPLEASLLRAASKPGRGLDKRIRPHLLVAAYQLQHLSDRIPAHAAVSAAVSSIKRVRPGLDGFANALLRHLGSPLHQLLKPTATLPEIAEAWGVPLPLAEAVTADRPASEQAEIVAGLCGRPQTWGLFFGSGVVEPPKQEVEIAAETGLPLAEVPLVPHAFVPRSHALAGGRITAQPGYVDGEFLVMDPGSTLCALAVAPAPGAMVLDLCSAPGGKAMVLADAVGREGRVIAVERHARRAQRIGENARRLGFAGRIETVVGDATSLDRPFIDQGIQADNYDAVLLDAPCSGLGTTRRKPEVKVARTDAAIAANLIVQQQLLNAAAARVKVGGVVVYSVCSPMPAEGHQQIEAFLATHKNFEREHLKNVLPWLPADTLDAVGQARLLPNRHDADAFFIARLRRTA
jgi:16S rRNA (cytosine967-C5)-methyltransferase